MSAPSHFVFSSSLFISFGKPSAVHFLFFFSALATTQCSSSRSHQRCSWHQEQWLNNSTRSPSSPKSKASSTKPVATPTAQQSTSETTPTPSSASHSRQPDPRSNQLLRKPPRCKHPPKPSGPPSPATRPRVSRKPRRPLAFRRK